MMKAQLHYSVSVYEGNKCFINHDLSSFCSRVSFVTGINSIFFETIKFSLMYISELHSLEVFKVLRLYKILLGAIYELIFSYHRPIKKTNKEIIRSVFIINSTKFEKKYRNKIYQHYEQRIVIR